MEHRDKNGVPFEANGKQYDLFPEASPPNNRYFYLIGSAVLIIVGVLLFVPLAFSQEHPAEHAQLHTEFYSKWMRQDDPSLSCCGGQDCFPTEIKFEAGKLYAKRLWDGKWVYIPPEKIDRRNVSPDGQNHACMANPFWSQMSLDPIQYSPHTLPEDIVYCFMFGAGT